MKTFVVFALITAVLISVLFSTSEIVDFTAWLDGLDDVELFTIQMVDNVQFAGEEANDLLQVLKVIWLHDYLNSGSPPAESDPWYVDFINSPFMEYSVGLFVRLLYTVVALGKFIGWVFDNLEIISPWEYLKPYVPFDWGVVA